jgi:hypothetical protein
MNVSRQIGWSNESNLLYQILKQLNRLTSVLFGLKEAATPKYKVYTALLTQSGGDYNEGIYSGELIIGRTYTILDMSDGSFTEVGAPNNNLGTSFVATGTTPNWGVDNSTGVSYNSGAPVVTVLENTIGNIWFTYDTNGQYSIYSDNLFPTNQSTVFISNNTDDIADPSQVVKAKLHDPSQFFLASFGTGAPFSTFIPSDSIFSNTPIEIRVYS